MTRTSDQALQNLAPYLQRWELQLDGVPIVTHSSDLAPVRFLSGLSGQQGRAAMLKLAHSAEEQRGHGLMTWWSGAGAARVYGHDGPALLLERLESAPALRQVAAEQDEQATQIFCEVAAQLHQPRSSPWPELVPLTVWFGSLERQASAGGVWQDCWQVAQALLSTQQEVRPLHGDLHHDNIWPRWPTEKWCVIDPKALLGERGYDYANWFFNPVPNTDPTTFLRRLTLVAHYARLDPTRLLGWIAAYGGLSAAWYAEDGAEAEAKTVLQVAQLALQLSKSVFSGG